MEKHIAATAAHCGEAAAACGAGMLRAVLAERGEATIVVATGASQFDMLATLTAEPGIAWNHVTVFHLDEYVGLPITHAASFRKYLWERFHSKLPLPVKSFHYINGEADPAAECARLGALMVAHPVDIAFIGIGENGHIAFNDPPADFETGEPYLVVTLDDACRRQQFGEGWFPGLDAVPHRAISMSVQQILRSASIVCTVPDERKAKAVRDALEGPVTPDVPASILQTHADLRLFLDGESASLLQPHP